MQKQSPRTPFWKRAWLLLPIAGLVGGWTGLAIGLSNVRTHRYRELGFDWLALDMLTTEVDRGMVTALAIGVVLTILVFLFRPLLQNTVGRWTGATIRDRFRVEVAVFCLFLGVGLLIFGWRILNERYIPFDYTKRYWVLNGAWLAGSALAAWILYYLLTATRLQAWLARRGVIAVVTLAGLTAAGVLVLNGYTRMTRPTASDNARDVIFITVDTQRADHLGCYGYARPTSPSLDALAASGQIYLNAFSHAPVTSSSFSCIMTGYRPRETGTYANDPAPLHLPTIAEYLRNSGYATSAIVSNFVLRRGKNHDQGFEHYDDHMDDREAVRKTPERIGANTTRDALAWLAGASEDRPLFLWVHYQDPHGPYTAPREYQSLFLDESALGNPLRVTDSVKGDGGIPSYQVLGHHREYGYYVAQYDAEIRYFDDCLRDLVEGLKTGGRWDDALVVLTSDHGEGMGEHGYYFAHGDHLYPGQLHVPLILWGPELPPARHEALAQSADIVPTVLDFAGIEAVTRLPGRSLLGGEGSSGRPDTLGGETPNGGDADRSGLPGVLSETFVSDNYKAAMTGRWLQVTYDEFNGDYRPYDIARGVYLDADSLATKLEWKALVDDLEKQRNPSASRLASKGGNTQEREMMKSLGYIN